MPMSARIIYMRKAPERLAVAQMQDDPYGPMAVTKAYVQLVYCMAAWEDQDAVTPRPLKSDKIGLLLDRLVDRR